MLHEWITNRLWDYKTIGNKMDNKWTATQNDYSDYWAQQKTLTGALIIKNSSGFMTALSRDERDHPNSATNVTYFLLAYS